MPVQMRESRRKAKAAFFCAFYVDCHQKAWPRVIIGLLASNDPIQKNPSLGLERWLSIKSTVCSSREPKSNSQHNPVTPVAGNMLLSSGLSRYCTHITHRHVAILFINERIAVILQKWWSLVFSITQVSNQILNLEVTTSQ